MHGNLPAQAQRAIFPADSLASEKSFTDSLATEPENKWFSALADSLWKPKPAAALDHFTSAKLHQCYRYASGRQEPPGLLIVELLQSSDGGRVLNHVMRGSTAAWWRQYQFALAALPAVEQLRQLQLPLK
jgi:hypothetical protein